MNNNNLFNDTSVAFSAKTSAQLRKAHLLFATMSKPWMVNAGKLMTKLGFFLHLPIKGIIKNTIYAQFCGGETIADSEETIKELAEFNIGTILDYSVEGADTEEGFEDTLNEILKTIDRSANDAAIPFSVFKVTGLAVTRVLEKVQQKIQLTSEEKESFEATKQRVDAICKKAYESNVRVFIDAEESWIQDCIDAMAYEMMQKYNREKTIVYNTYQLYRSDMLTNLEGAYQVAEEEGYWLGAKLVRGAYMEKEADRAEEKGYKNPIQPNKEATDRDFNEALKFCVENKERIAFCAGSHNQYSNYYLTELMEQHGLQNNDERVYFAQLYGMSDNISFNLANKGYNVAKYVPYGPVKSVMPYLFRRAEENTSIAGQTGREFSLIKEELKRRKQTA